MAQPLELVRLQKPAWVFFDGAVRPWEEAVFHVSSEAVLRGLNVFEGLKGYWQPNGRFAVVEMRRHFERLCRSARILQIPVDVTYDEYVDACSQLVGRLLTHEQDMWIRVTLYGVEGHWGAGTRADMVLTAYHQEKRPHEPMAVGVSTWQRSSDLSLPARVKTSTNYQVARLARIEGRGRGYEDMILLNQAGRVAEGTGACLLLARAGRIATPPPSEGALESITVDIVEELCRDEGIPFERRPIERTELLVADELALAGTIVEVTAISAIDELPLPGSADPVLVRVAARYRDAVTGIRPHGAIELTEIAPDPHAVSYSVAMGAVRESTRDLFQIGEAAERAGLSLRTVRLYEEMGLVRPSARSKGGFRLFSEKDVQRLLVLKGMKPMGLTLEQMREIAGVLDRTESPQSLETRELSGSTDDLMRLVELSEQRLARLERHMAEARKLAQRIADRAAVCRFELERRAAADGPAASSGSG